MIKKNQQYEVEIKDISHLGSGVAKINNFIVFIDMALPGDILKVLIVKVKKKYGYGKILEIITPSLLRVKSVCPVFKSCGGCNFLHMDYSSQLSFKQKQFVNLFENNGFNINHIKEVLQPIEHLNSPYNYRNKVIFPVGLRDYKIEIGFYKKNTHEIVDFINCHIQQKINQNILENIRKAMEVNGVKPYNEIEKTGIVRNIFIRQGHVSKEIMVALIINRNDYTFPSNFFSKLISIQNVESILVNYNTKNSNAVLGQKTELIYGKPYIKDYIGSIKYNISLHSFYQINSIMCEKLYTDIVKFADFNGHETVMDAYCGIGTISLFIAKFVKKIFAIEIVPQAITDGKENAKINNITNVDFICGKVENLVNNFNEIDIAIIDPPRKGVEKNVIKALLSLRPKKIFYISCNPKTLVRDLELLSPTYEINIIKTYDFFPHSLHIESLTVLWLKQ